MKINIRMNTKLRILFTILSSITVGLLIAVAVMAWTNPSGNPPTGSGSLANLAGSRVSAANNFQNSSDTFADITSASITLTTGARRAFLSFSSKIHNNTAGCGVQLRFTVDGGGVGEQRGANNAGGNESHIATITYLTDVLSAGSHTFKVQAARDNLCGTAIINDATNGIFSVFETPIQS